MSTFSGICHFVLRSIRLLGWLAKHKTTIGIYEQSSRRKVAVRLGMCDKSTAANKNIVFGGLLSSIIENKSLLIVNIKSFCQTFTTFLLSLFLMPG